MKNEAEKSVKSAIAFLPGITLLFLPFVLNAAVHMVQFGGSLGLAYSPANFAANVGDTVQWNGTFSMHPISSTTIPAGAATWHVTSGTTFSYVIRVGGAYNYQCDLHIAQGMIASFSAVTSAVAPWMETVKNNSLMSVRVISSKGQAFLRLNMRTNEFVSSDIFSLSGMKRAALVSGRIGPGTYTIPVHGIGPGTYLVRVLVGGQEISENVLVTR